MVGKVDENQKQGPEMDPDTSISFDLSLAASQEFCRRRRRVLENMSNVSLLTTKSFGVNDTMKSVRSSSTKSIEWEERLKALAEVIRSIDEDNWAERVAGTLEKSFNELSAVLCQISVSKRPPCTFELITAFAVAIVKLQQWHSFNGYKVHRLPCVLSRRISSKAFLSSNLGLTGSHEKSSFTSPSFFLLLSPPCPASNEGDVERGNPDPTVLWAAESNACIHVGAFGSQKSLEAAAASEESPKVRGIQERGGDQFLLEVV
ncbi:unnamed protein product [Toxocara canis]|uniref:Uncharacterized protein n=1 Tax=Toxocara canis TaxID=6265 RepID=A0A183USX8_TOXCA|nr:unnamed protein product [Toxocara canis]